MLSFDTLGLPPALRRSLEGALAARFPQTVLLIGAAQPAYELARVLAAALLCERGAPCGVCASCNKVAHDAHPDLIRIDEEGELKIEVARSIRREASILPNDGAHKVFLIRGADRLNIPAQNALLKVLEEPPRYCFFLLLAEQPDRILETILSRCTSYRLPPESKAADAPDEELCALLAPYLDALAQGSELRMMEAAMPLEKLPRPRLREWLGLLQIALRDAVFAADRLGPPLLPALAAQTRALSCRVTVEHLNALYVHCARLAGRTEVNASAAAMTCALTAEMYECARGRL